MKIEEALALLPADRQEEAKVALAEHDKAVTAGLVKIDSVEAADAFWRIPNSPMRRAVDAEVSRAVAAHDERFKAEKLPTLLEEEYKKRNPSKDPRDLKIEELERKMNEKEKAAARKEQLLRAQAALAEKGIPKRFAEQCVGDDDVQTDSKVAELVGEIQPWADALVQSEVVKRLGSGAPPSGGQAKPLDLKAEYAKAQAAGDVNTMMALKSRMEREAKKT